MTTPAQLTANQRNGQLSAGPKSPQGKARSSKNALRHGFRSEVPVLPGEDGEQWQAHQAGILRSLAPVGSLETELANRVALALWRLRRVAAYETAVTAVGLEEVPEKVRFTGTFDQPDTDQQKLEKVLAKLKKKTEVVDLWEGTLHLLEQLPELPDNASVDGDDVDGVFQDLVADAPEGTQWPDPDDAKFLATLGVPEDERHDAYNWDGWTVGMVRSGLDRFAQAAKTTPEKLLARASAGRAETQATKKADAARLQREAQEIRRRIKAREDRLRQRCMLLGAPELDKVLRYESHLTRQMLQALHTLERLQANRAGQAVPPPAALDVTVEADNPSAAASHAVARMVEQS